MYVHKSVLGKKISKIKKDSMCKIFNDDAERFENNDLFEQDLKLNTNGISQTYE